MLHFFLRGSNIFIYLLRRVFLGFKSNLKKLFPKTLLKNERVVRYIKNYKPDHFEYLKLLATNLVKRQKIKLDNF